MVPPELCGLGSSTLSLTRVSSTRGVELEARIRERRARVDVIGCGYVGLPLSVAFASAGYSVVGIDNNKDRVAALQVGESFILDVPSDLLRTQVDSGRFTATSDYGAVRDADVIFISVPTPFDRAKQPDLSYVLAAAEGIRPNLRAGQLVILESTTFPGTTDEVLRP